VSGKESSRLASYKGEEYKVWTRRYGVNAIVEIVRRHHPDVQAVYLFGTHGTQDEWPDSDVDIALLLPVPSAKKAGSLAMGVCRGELGSLLGKEVDLINLRCVDTVVQSEILHTARELFVGDRMAADDFNILVMSLYQKLTEERAEIVREILLSGRVYDV
jgi:predicted nucleotidyltransferase